MQPAGPDTEPSSAAIADPLTAAPIDDLYEALADRLQPRRAANVRDDGGLGRWPSSSVQSPWSTSPTSRSATRSGWPGTPYRRWPGTSCSHWADPRSTSCCTAASSAPRRHSSWPLCARPCAEATRVDLLADAAGDGYVARVLLAGLDVWQRSGDVDRFDYRVVLVEYVEPPAAPTLEAMPGIDTSLAQEAAGYLDDVQDAVSAGLPSSSA